MGVPTFTFEASLVDFRGVRRTIAVRSDQSLDDLHEALRAAFGWDDEHLYSFWLDGEFWSPDGEEYSHPWHAAEPGPLAGLGFHSAPKSAEVRLDRLDLTHGDRIAYVFDFGDEWRVRLTVRDGGEDDGGAYPRLLRAVGDAPPQYGSDDEIADVA
jgi:hypothetical protein